MFTHAPYRIALVLERKPYWIRRLFTQKNSDFRRNFCNGGIAYVASGSARVRPENWNESKKRKQGGGE